MSYYRCRCGYSYAESLGANGCTRCEARRPAKLVTPKPMVRSKPLLPGVKRMKQGRSTGKPTKAQQSRFDAMKERGCVIARLRGQGMVYGELHHMTVGGKHGAKRLGHDATVCLNAWSHRGEAFGQWDTPAKCLEAFGPSYAKEPRAFRALYPDHYLTELQRRVLELTTEQLDAGASELLALLEAAA